MIFDEGALFFPDLIGSFAQPPAFFGFGIVWNSKLSSSSSKELLREWFGSFSNVNGIVCVVSASFAVVAVALLVASAAAAAAARRPFFAD